MAERKTNMQSVYTETERPLDQKVLTWCRTDHFSNIDGLPRIFSWLLLIYRF